VIHARQHRILKKLKSHVAGYAHSAAQPNRSSR
jgi:hypothetical protein